MSRKALNQLVKEALIKIYRKRFPFYNYVADGMLFYLCYPTHINILTSIPKQHFEGGKQYEWKRI